MLCMSRRIEFVVTRMAAPPKKPQEFDPKSILGLKYFKLLKRMLGELHKVGTERDKAGNRTLFFDQYASLILLYFFNPVLTALRSIQQASGLKNVQKALGCSETSLGSLSEASRVFDADFHTFRHPKFYHPAPLSCSSGPGCKTHDQLRAA